MVAHFYDLEATVYRAALLFVGANAFMKVGLRKFNGFDALAVILLISAVAQPFLMYFGYILEIALSGIVVATVAFSAGAPRKAMLFISSIIVFTESLTWSERMVGEMDDIERCTPVNMAAFMQCGLLLLVGYAVYVSNDDGFKLDDIDQDAEMKLWVVIVVAACTARSVAISCDCEQGKQNASQLMSMLKTIVLVSACVANGEDETVPEET
jgi:hypothetical protein